MYIVTPDLLHSEHLVSIFKYPITFCFTNITAINLQSTMEFENKYFVCQHLAKTDKSGDQVPFCLESQNECISNLVWCNEYIMSLPFILAEVSESFQALEIIQSLHNSLQTASLVHLIFARFTTRID